MQKPATKAVFFDVDFTLIYPGPRFQAQGYQEFCAHHGVQVDPSGFEAAVADASVVLDSAQEHIYSPQVFIDYTSRIIEGMGGSGPGVLACSREIYDEWAANHHFSLYDEVPAVLRDLHANGVSLALISNTHRCLTTFQTHFQLEGLITAAVSSYEHGYMKPHPSIFEAALGLVGVEPHEAVMVGDSLVHDIEGARRIGIRGVLVCRSKNPPGPIDDVPVISNLAELAAHL